MISLIAKFACCANTKKPEPEKRYYPRIVQYPQPDELQLRIQIAANFTIKGQPTPDRSIDLLLVSMKLDTVTARNREWFEDRWSQETAEE